MADPGFWKEAAGWSWGLLVPLGWYVLSTRDKRIEKVEETLKDRASSEAVKELSSAIHSLRGRMITREDFREHEVRDDRDRTERREQEILLFEKVDDLKDDINTKFNVLKDLIIARTK